ncbi:MAG TPA: DUF1684 domain-containing protein [Terracidiphilus sp.]
MRHFIPAALIVLSTLAVPPASPAQSVAPAASASSADAEAAWRGRLETWRSQREHELTAPDGWLTLVALDWLKSGANTVGSAPDNQIKVDNAPAHMGMFTVSGKTVQLLAPIDGFAAGLQLDGQPAHEGMLSADDRHPSTLTFKSLTMVVLPRGGRYALRIKDANSPSRTGFRGLHWYAPDLRFTVEARWIPNNPPRTLKIPTVIGTTLDLPSPGTAEFTLNGKTIRLEPVLEDPHDTTLFYILRDTTSQTTTYQAGRFLRTAFPEKGLDKPGTLILDFNQLFNPPCAYTPYATCPLPPDENRLPVPIEAGEQRYAP